jgi:hypothetical protein
MKSPIQKSAAHSPLKNALWVAVPISGAFIASEADAQAVFAVNQTINSSDPEFFIDVDGESFASGISAGADLILAFTAGQAAKPTARAASGSLHLDGGYVANLLGGTLIDAALMSGDDNTDTFINLNFNGANDANWASGTQGYIGFSFVSGETTYFGYADVTYNLGQLYIGNVGYQAGGILAGAAAVPEPSTYAMLAGLLAGSAALLRRRQQRKAVAA